MFGADLAQRLDVAPAPLAEMKVGTDHDSPCREAVDDDLVGELFGRHRCARLVKGDDQCEIDPGLGQQLQLVVEIAQQQRCRFRPHHGGRVTVECHDRGCAAALGCQAMHLGDHGSMPPVDAVVLPHGHNAAVLEHRAPIQVADDLHAGNATQRLSR